MTDTLKLVEEFHTKFGHPVESELKIPDIKIIKLRLELILEEFIELVDANLKGVDDPSLIQGLLDCKKLISYLEKEHFEVDLIEVADALGDIKYVIDGTALVYGIPLNEISNEIHKSNMSKLNPETGKAIYSLNGKILKGSDYFKPDIKKVLSR